MNLRYCLDEQLRRRLWRAVQGHNRLGVDVIDVTRVGDPPDLPLGTTDADLLLWCERESRILVSLDRDTMLAELQAHLQAGHHSPGVFIVRRPSTVPPVIAFLVYAAYSSLPDEWADSWTSIP